MEPLEEADTSAFGRTIAALVGLAALIGASLAILEAVTQRAEGTADARSSRLAVQLVRDSLVFGAVDTFKINAEQEATYLNDRAISQTRVATIVDRSLRELEEAIGAAYADSAGRVLAIAQRMGAAPGPSDGLDPVTVRSLNSTLPSLNEQLAEQISAADQAEREGRRHGQAVLALTILALAAILLGLAGTLKETSAGWVSLGAAGFLLAVSLTVGMIGALG